LVGDLHTVPVTDELVASAAELAEDEGLRGYDAIHLAAALTVLISAAAARRGLHVANPLGSEDRHHRRVRRPDAVSSAPSRVGDAITGREPRSFDPETEGIVNGHVLVAVEAEASAQCSELLEIITLDRQRVQHRSRFGDRDVRRLGPEVTDPEAATLFVDDDETHAAVEIRGRRHHGEVDILRVLRTIETES
jgi:hypothetical protein